VACMSPEHPPHDPRWPQAPQGSPRRSPRPSNRPSLPPGQRWRVASAELIDEITTAAECIGAACTALGERVYPNDAEVRLLRVIERSHYCLCIADVARALHVSRQAAHRVVYSAAAAGRVELLPNPDDRRILQLRLTAMGRSELKALRACESAWLFALLNGLGDRDMAVTAHVLRIIRQRLQRDARELAWRKLRS
jgi:DNA-binding MarR family transcriptional regulator